MSRSGFKPNPLSLIAVMLLPLSPILYGFSRQTGREHYLVSDPLWLIMPSMLGAIIFILILLFNIQPIERYRSKYYIVAFLLPTLILMSGFMYIQQSKLNAVNETGQIWAVATTLRYDQCPQRKRWFQSDCNKDLRSTEIQFHLHDGQKFIALSEGGEWDSWCMKVTIKNGYGSDKWLGVSDIYNISGHLTKDGILAGEIKHRCFAGKIAITE